MILKEKQLKSISKFLSFILRHHPEQIGITLDKDGWVDIDTLLTQVNHPERGFTGNPLTTKYCWKWSKTMIKNGLPF